ncbi:hypothetical protein BBJ28_00001890 [Nothophytophthora sp. Chile5]|nr:hypothetical protein BBJ28_00001890 [Nothophytophthora sp. Chile5]
MEAESSRLLVFDGSSDFHVWRARVENALMRHHLLGYVLVPGYDGSQSFTYNGEEVPPKRSASPVEHTPQKPSALGVSKQADSQVGASRWDALVEAAEAKNILQHHLHPDVECAILSKSIYDSWATLCAMHDERSGRDLFEMHRVLHHMRLGDKKGESAHEFLTRWEMVVQQYALVMGIELTDGFRYVMLMQTLPSAWRPVASKWRGKNQFVPYSEMVAKVIEEHERQEKARAQETHTKVAEKAKASEGSNNSIDLTGDNPSPTANATRKQRPGADKVYKYHDETRRQEKDRYEKCSDFEPPSRYGGRGMCFYCLRTNHELTRCRYLSNDIATGKAHRQRGRYSCEVTAERKAWMVDRLEKYINEEERKCVTYSPVAFEEYRHEASSGPPHRLEPRDWQQLPQSPDQAFQDCQANRRRSRSVFQPAEGRTTHRDPRFARSQSRFRDATDYSPPRKRTRTPSFERVLRIPL